MAKLMAVPRSITCERIHVVRTKRPELEAERFWNSATRGKVAKSVQNNKYLRVELQSGVIVVLKRKGVNGNGTIDISVSTKKVRESTR